MAKIKLGALANDVRGSVAGQTFSRGRYGSYSRQKVSGVQPRTARQLAQRSIFTLATQSWRTLTGVQQAAWNSYAANHPIVDVFGDSQILAGNAAYVKTNSNRQLCGLDIADTPPADVTDMPAAALSAAAVASTGDVTVTTETQTADMGFYGVFVSPGVSPGATPGRQSCRLGGDPVATGTGTTAVVTPAEFNEKLGFIAGQKVIVFVVRYDPNGVVVDSTRFDIIAS